MLLYDSAISGNCYKVRLLLAHLGTPYERRELSVTDRSNRPKVLGGLNPALRVPTLVLDDGRPLGESNAILWYLGDGTRYAPTERYERAQVMQWARSKPSVGAWRAPSPRYHRMARATRPPKGSSAPRSCSGSSSSSTTTSRTSPW